MVSSLPNPRKSWLLHLLLSLLLSLMVAACATGDRPHILVEGSDAPYPAAAKAQGVEGYVVVVYDVTEAGGVENARVVESDPAGVFDDAALQSVRRWRFSAARRDGVPVRVREVRSRVTFALSGADRYADF